MNKSSMLMLIIMNVFLVQSLSAAEREVSPTSDIDSVGPVDSPRVAFKKPIEIRAVKVLQQKTDQPWMLHGKNLETINGGSIFGHPELKWGNVRREDGTNCGYHAVKNLRIFMDALNNRSIDVDIELNKPSSVLNRQLNDLDELIQHIPEWSTKIYDKRKQDVINALRKKSITVPERDVEFKALRPALPEMLRSRVNINDGHIKTEDLDGAEIENLIKEEPELKDKVIAFEYIPGIPVDMMMSENMQAKIDAFKAASNAQLGIVWNEEGFHHWVAYVAVKREKNVTLYRLNSIGHKQPVHEPELLKLLQS
ncbi:hypothetical protein KAZ82_02545 [Candidatus Babeliales bacterium]|nr:hypothetical protein [Candidatus Babeliales bacterium]